MPGSLSDLPSGLIGGYQDGSLIVQIFIAVFSAIAIYNALEIMVLIGITFKHQRSLYFWALLLSSTLGILPHSVGYLLEFFAKGPIWLAVSISTVGFYFMVPGQSFVLYSRLHLITTNRKLIRSVFYLILADAIVLTIPTTVFTYATIYLRTKSVVTGYNTMERVQLSWFCAQEILLSGIYIYETIQILSTRPGKDPQRTRILWELIVINIIIICLDITLVSFEYLSLYILQTTLKSAVYSVKLKLEFRILTKLVALCGPRPEYCIVCGARKVSSCVDLSKITSDIRCTVTVPARAYSRCDRNHDRSNLESGNISMSVRSSICEQ